MRKMSLCLLLLAFAMLSVAAPVSERDAKASAAEFFGIVQTKADGDLTLVMTGGKSTEHPAFYVYNRKGGGFVIISGNNVSEKVIGYSYENSIDPWTMPANVRHWMKLLEHCTEIPATKAGSSHTVVVSLPTAKWDQGEPYNWLCPEFSGQHCVTGCTNTATATIMYYYRWPVAGSGTLPGYSYYQYRKKVDIPGHDLGHTYEWDNMLFEYKKGRYSEEQGNAVATLMYDCGVMNQSEYGLDGTGAYVWAAEVLPKYMGYDPGIWDAYRYLYDDSHWIRLMKEELDQQRPILYYNDEHAFVIDGYDSSDYFSVNFGWGGYGNGYYPVSVHDYKADDDVHFVGDRERNYAVFGIRPDTHSTIEKKVVVSYMTCSDRNALLKGEMFEQSFTFTSLKGMFNGSICIALVDKNNEIKEIVSDEMKLDQPLQEQISYDFDVNCWIRSSIKPTDVLVVCYRRTGEKEWSVGQGSSLPVVDTRFIAVNPKGYRAGDKFKCVLVDGPDSYTVGWAFDGRKVEPGAEIILDSGIHKVKATIYGFDKAVERIIIQEIEVK